MNILTQAAKTFGFIKSQIVADPKTELSQEQFIAFRDAFRTLARNKSVTSADMLLYNIVRGKPADYGFTPITNKIKLSNGQQYNGGFFDARFTVKSFLTNNLDYLNTRFGKFLGDMSTYESPKPGISRMEQLEKRSPYAFNLYTLVDKR